MKQHPDKSSRTEGGHDTDADDGATPPGIDADTLGLGGSLNRFIKHVDAILARPSNNHVTAGRDGATDAGSKLFWTYDRHEGLDVRAAAGLLTTATGDGGFRLHVDTDGSWSLRFDGTHTVIGHEAGDPKTPPPPPVAGLPVVDVVPVTLLGQPPSDGSGAAFYDGASKKTGSGAVAELIRGNAAGWDTFQGGVGDYMIGGAGTAGGGLPGKGNCAVYTASRGSILVDMQNGHGYGGNAEGNTYDNMNQVRGSFHTNVLIGDSNGTDLKSGGDNSLLVSTGGQGFEMRPDGRGNVLVSTAGGDRVTFDASHDWQLGDDNIMLGFDPAHGCSIDLTALDTAKTLAVLGGGTVVPAWQAGSSQITDFVRFADVAKDGTHVFYDPLGHAQGGGGYDLIDLKFTHGLDVRTLYDNHQILA